MQTLTMCTFLAFIAVLKVSGTSKKVLDFVSIVNGDYNNKEQTQEAGDDHAFSQVRVIPVDIKCLRPDPVLFVEDAVNGVISVFVLVVVKDGIGDTISLTIYNHTDYTKYKSGEYKVDKLSNISCGDLQGDKDCIGSYTVSSKGFAFGNFPQCRMTVNEQHPRFTGMFSCDSITATVPMDSDQVSPIEPYEFLLKRNKYPLINAPQDYEAPCDN